MRVDVRLPERSYVPYRVVRTGENWNPGGRYVWIFPLREGSLGYSRGRVITEQKEITG